MRSTILLTTLATIALLGTSGDAQAELPFAFNQVGRRLGIGSSAGYHAHNCCRCDGSELPRQWRYIHAHHPRPARHRTHHHHHAHHHAGAYRLYADDWMTAEPIAPAPAEPLSTPPLPPTPNSIRNNEL